VHDVDQKRLKKRKMQRCGIEVSAGALSYATMKSFYDEPDRDVAIDTLRRAREIGIDFLDSSNGYGRGRNEELEGHRHEYVIASKFGNLRAADGSPARQGTGPLHPNRVMVLRFDLGQSSKERFAFCCRPESEPSLLDQIGSRKLRRGNRQCEELSIWFPAQVARRLIPRTLIWLLAPAKRNVGKIAQTGRYSSDDGTVVIV
jgi:hypothetical protein